MPTSVFVAIPLMIVLTVLQTAVLPRFPVLGYVPQLSFLVAVSWGLISGMEQGVIWAFIAGICQDLFTVAPVGGSAITYMAAVLLVTAVVRVLPTNRFLLPMLLGALATLVQQLLYFIYLRLFGYGLTLPALTGLLPLVVLNGVVILPVYWLTLMLNRTFRPRAVEI